MDRFAQAYEKLRTPKLTRMRYFSERQSRGPCWVGLIEVGLILQLNGLWSLSEDVLAHQILRTLAHPLEANSVPFWLNFSLCYLTVLSPGS